jgi:ComEC/Rec2-related protein
MRAELESRPFVILAAGLILGLTFSRQPINVLFVVALVWVVTGLRARILMAAALVAGSLLSPGPSPPPILDSQFIDTTWKVETLPKLTPFGQRCEIGHGAVRLMMTYDGPIRLCPGALIHLKGVAQPPVEGMEQYFASHDLIGRIQASGPSLRLIEDGPWIQRLGCNWRDLFLEFTSENLPARAASATAALCFNADGLLDTTTREEMQHTGTTHIIAASGLQVVVLAQCLLWLFAWLPLPRWLQLGVVAFILLLYAAGSGLNPPVVRACVMWAIANYAFIAKREPDWLSALAASSLIFLIWKPGTIYDMGFQFSVAAVLFLALFGGHIRWRPGIEAWLKRQAMHAVRASIVAFVVVTPLIAYHFGAVSLISIPANILVVFAVAPIVILAMVALPVAVIWPPIGNALLQGSVPFTSYIDAVLHSFGGERAAVQVPPFSAYWLVPLYLALLMLWRPYIRPA